MTRALKLFVDFDGTITKRDVGNAFFREFGGVICDEYVARYRSGEISAAECFRRELHAVGDLNLEAVSAFLAQQNIDPAFSGFVAFCRERSIPLHILSDGLDFYIRTILADRGIGPVSFLANELTVSEPDASGNARLAIAFPHGNAECTRCACCKRNAMLGLAGDDDLIGYVGEGFSDLCPAQYADIDFAKDELQTYCQRENISYFTYRTFADVVHRLDSLLSRNLPRKRARAALKRREVFMRES